MAMSKIVGLTSKRVPLFERKIRPSILLYVVWWVILLSKPSLSHRSFSPVSKGTPPPGTVLRVSLKH